MMEKCIANATAGINASNRTYLTAQKTDAVYINVVLNAILALGGLFGNGVIIIAFFRRKALQNVNNVFLVQLAFVDLTKAVFILPVKVYTNLRMLSSELDEGQCFDLGSYCQLSGFISTITFIHSALLLAAIAVVRYFKMVRSSSFKRIFERRNMICYCIALALATMILASLPLVGVGLYAYSPYHGICFTNWGNENKTYRIIFYVYTMGIGYVTILFCYWRIYCKLRQHRKDTQASLDSARTTSHPDRYRKRTDSKRKTDEGQSQVSAGEISMSISSEASERNAETRASSDGTQSKPTESFQKDGPVETRGTTSTERSRGKPWLKKLAPSYHAELKVTKIMFAIVVAYNICWVPAFLVNIVMLSTQGSNSGNSRTIDPIVLFFIITVVDCKVLVNPVIYGLCNVQFRREIKKLFCKSFCLNAD